LTWFNGYCGGRGKRGALVEKGKSPWERYTALIFFNDFFLGGGREEMTKGWADLIFFKTAFFGHILKNKSTRSLFGAWSFLLVHTRCTPSEGPKGFGD
jgi:hypothetical protein